MYASAVTKLRYYTCRHAKLLCIILHNILHKILWKGITFYVYLYMEVCVCELNIMNVKYVNIPFFIPFNKLELQEM